MTAVTYAMPLISLLLALGALLPWVIVHVELRARAGRRLATELARRDATIEDLEATIEAYRVLVSTDSAFSLSIPCADPNDVGTSGSLSA